MDKKTEEEIQAFLREMAEAEWKQSERPYLLSLAAPELKKRGIDYRAVLGPEKLKTFAKRTEAAGGYRLVEHPTHRAKVGVVPAGVPFEFPATPDKSGIPMRASRSDRERIVIEFLRALSSLPDEDLKTINIPTSVLAKLLARR